MRELLTLSFGNYSNYANTHFWNLNLELLKSSQEEIGSEENNEFIENSKSKSNEKESNKILLNNSVIYNDYNKPRCLIFDTSDNFKNYYQRNTKLKAQEEKKLIEETQYEK